MGSLNLLMVIYGFVTFVDLMLQRSGHLAAFALSLEEL
jgi:hypothetical protein